MSAGTIFRALSLLLATILCCVGTGLGQIKFFYTGGTGIVKVYLFESLLGDKTKIKHGDIMCDNMKGRFDAAYAFAIISCIVIGFAFITAALQLTGSSIAKVGKYVSTGLTAFGFVSSLICWAIVVGTFRATPCDGLSVSAYAAGGAIDIGCQLMICTCGVMLVNLIASVFGFIGEDECAAAALPTSPFTGIRFVVLFIASLFITLGTGLPQLRLKFADASLGESVLSIFLYTATLRAEHYATEEKLATLLNCSETNSRFRAAYAFGILSCIFIVLALFAVAVQFATTTTKIPSLILSVCGFVTSLIAWCIVVGTWYKGDMCSAPVSPKDIDFKLSSGLALLIVSWILMIIDMVAAIVSVAVSPAALAAAAASTEMEKKEEPASA